MEKKIRNLHASDGQQEKKSFFTQKKKKKKKKKKKLFFANSFPRNCVINDKNI